MTHPTATLRPMYLGDLQSALKIIESHDDDDAEAAEAEYQEEGLDNQFVLEANDKVIGVSGFRTVTATDGTCWLSWTYLDKAAMGQGQGGAMIRQVLDAAREAGGRKLFAKVSDYEDPEQGPVYAQAMQAYQALGFTEELVGNDFYDEAENQHILGLRLKDRDADAPDEVAAEKPTIRFNGLFEIAETDGAYSFNWDVAKSSLLGRRSFSREDVEIGLQAAKQQGGRKVFLTFPANLPLIHAPLQEAGFKYVGRLTDYYEDGLDELHFVHELNE
ncbi:MAG: N-acetyltransferase family protein [Pseudomonadales bacterium]